MYANDPYEENYQFLINKQESVGLKYFNDSKVFIEHSNEMEEICKTIEEYILNKKRKVLIAFNDMLSNKKT